METSFIEQIAQGKPYEKDKILGYSEYELNVIERLYSVKVSGNFRKFMLEMGRCDGGLIGGGPIVVYGPDETPRSLIILGAQIEDEICDAGQYELSRLGPFVFSIESETQLYYVVTKSDKPDKIYRFDESNQTIHDTGFSFLEYMQHIVRVWGGRSTAICRGELLMV